MNGKTGITWARGWTTRSPTFSFSAPHIKTLNQISWKDSLSPIMSNIFQMLKKKLFVPRTKPLYHFSSYQSWFIPSVSWTIPELTSNFYQAVSDYPPCATSSWVSIIVWLSSWSEKVAVIITVPDAAAYWFLSNRPKMLEWQRKGGQGADLQKDLFWQFSEIYALFG